MYIISISPDCAKVKLSNKDKSKQEKDQFVIFQDNVLNVPENDEEVKKNTFKYMKIKELCLPLH